MSGVPLQSRSAWDACHDGLDEDRSFLSGVGAAEEAGMAALKQQRDGRLVVGGGVALIVVKMGTSQEDPAFLNRLTALEGTAMRQQLHLGVTLDWCSTRTYTCTHTHTHTHAHTKTHTDTH